MPERPSPPPEAIDESNNPKGLTFRPFAEALRDFELPEKTEAKIQKRLWLELFKEQMKEHEFTDMRGYIDALYAKDTVQHDLFLDTQDAIGFADEESAMEVKRALDTAQVENIDELPYIDGEITDGERDDSKSIYRELGTIGKGGMGQIYSALDERTGRIVAIKILHQKHITQEALLVRFAREAFALNKTSQSPFIVKILDVVSTAQKNDQNEMKELIGIVMDYVRGEDLFDTMRHQETYTHSEWFVASVATQIALALMEMHRVGILHRDLGLENVFLSIEKNAHPENGEIHVRVADFGIS